MAKRPLKVMVAIITLWSFLFNTVFCDVTWAAKSTIGSTSLGPIGTGSPGVSKELNVDTFSLPEYLGHIKDSCKGNASKKVVIHIQDAHCNYAAQHKISDIIEYLHNEYGIDTINLEGGKGEYDLSIFTRIYDKGIREKVADYFVKEGLVNGAEYFAINNPEKAELWGVEDTELYLKNLNVYRESLKHKDTIEKYLKELDHIISNLKRHIYNPELLEMDQKYTEYKTEKLEFKDYLTYLIQKSQSKAIDIKTLTNIYLLHQSLNQENEIDFKIANNERNNLIDRFEKMFSKRAIEELIQKTVEFKAEQISQKDYYTYLVKKANQMGLDLKNYPELQKYIVYISTYEAIDKAKIMEELTVLETKLKESIFENDDQKTLDTLSKNLVLTKNIFNISISREDWEYYKKNEKFFDMQNYTVFIDKKAPIYKITAKLDNNITTLDRYRKDISEFYDYSFKRDKVFLSNIKPANATLLITGGFHTDNLCELFKKKDISYISIMPNFKNGNGYESPYFRILSGKNNKILQTLMERSHTLAWFTYFCGESGKVHGSTEDAMKLWIRLEKAVLESGNKGQVEVTENGVIYIMPPSVQMQPLANAEQIKGVDIAGRPVFVKIGGQGSAIGKIFNEDGEIIKQGIKLKVPEGAAVGDHGLIDLCDANGNVLKDKSGQPLHLSLDGKVEQDKVGASIKAIKHLALETHKKDLSTAEIALVEKIVKFLEDLNAKGEIYYLGSTVKNPILGFSDGEKLLISRELSTNPVALFHEAGEGYFALHPEEAAKLGMSPHEFLRGTGKKERKKIKVEQSENLIAILKSEFKLGLQDKLFGQEINEALTQKIKELMKETTAGIIAPPSIFSPSMGNTPYEQINKLIADMLKEAKKNPPINIILPKIEPVKFDFDKLKEIYEAQKKIFSEVALAGGAGGLGAHLNLQIKYRTKWYTRLLMPFIKIYYYIKEYIGSLIYPFAARHNWSRTAAYTAGYFETKCIKKNLNLGTVLEKLYGKTLKDELPEAFASLYNASIDGFSQSPFITQLQAHQYITHLKQIFDSYSSLEDKEYWAELMSGMRSVRNLGVFVENPSFKTRAAVGDFSLRPGFTLIPDAGLVKTLGGDVKKLPHGKFILVKYGRRKQTSVQFLKEKIDAQNRLLDSNFAVLELLSQKMGDMDRGTLNSAIELVDIMANEYMALTAQLDSKTYKVAEIASKWAELKKKLASYTKEDLRHKEVVDSIYSIKETEKLEEITSLHEFINFLHQASFLPVFEWARMAESAVSIKIHNKTLDFVDVSSYPIIQGDKVSSTVLKSILPAFEEHQSASIRSSFVINDDLLIGHLKLGLHKAEIQVRLAPPDDGGMIMVRYQEWGEGAGNQARLAYLEKVMTGLGLDVQITGGRYMRIRLDKDHKAKSMEEIRRTIPLVIKALYYSRDLDLHIKDYRSAIAAAEVFLQQGYIQLAQVHMADMGLYMQAAEGDQLLKLNERLAALGVPPIPSGVKLTQRNLDIYINEPIDGMIDRGELVWDSENHLLIRNPNYHPIDDILRDLSGNVATSMQIAEAIAPAIPLIDFQDIGVVGKFLIQIGTFESNRGDRMIVTVIRNPDTNHIIFARVIRKENPDIALSATDLQKLTKAMGLESVAIEPISQEEADSYKQRLYERWVDEPLAGAVAVKGIASSSGKTGRRILGTISMKKEKATVANTILMTSHTGPSDGPIMSSFAGIVTTSGGILAHAAITSRELGIPSIILPNAQLVEEADGANKWEITTYVPVDIEKNADGFLVSKGIQEKRYRIGEGDRILLDGIEGAIILETEKGALDKVTMETKRVAVPEPKPLVTVQPTMPAKVRDESIIPLGNLRKEDFSTAGPKGANLGELRSISKKMHFVVPNGFVVTVKAFEEFIKEAGIDIQINNILQSDIPLGDKYEKIQAIFVEASNKASGNLKKLIKFYAKQVKKGNVWWSVRSSNIGEDSPEAAFAGLGDTYLFVSTNELFENVIRNFSSFATPRALAYRAERHLDNRVSHAVVVQEMVDSDISGVIFTKDPVTENKDRVVINASYGLGEAVVSGMVQPDQYVTDKSTTREVKEAFIGSKRVQVISRAEGPGTKTVSTPMALRNKRALSRAWVSRLTQAAKEIEAHYGFPVDIEFAIKGDTLYILQARPITTGVAKGAVAAIGKFIEIEPINVNAKGQLVGIIENVDTKEQLDLSGLAQRRASPEEIEKHIKGLERLIQYKCSPSHPQHALLSYILEQFKYRLPKHIIITTQTKAGFFGVGKPDLMVINAGLLHNPVSFLHEIIEYLKTVNPEIIPLMEASLLEYQRMWIDMHEEKYTKEGKLDYFLANKAHYIIRAFTQQVFTDIDRELTSVIKRTIEHERALQEKYQMVISPTASYKKSIADIQGDREFAEQYRHLPNNQSRIEFLLKHYQMPGVKIDVETIPPSPFVPKGTGRAEKIGPKHYKITLIGVEGDYEEYLLFHEFMHFWLDENGYTFTWDTKNDSTANYLFHLRNTVNDYLIEKENRRRFGNYYAGITKDLRDYDLQGQLLYMAGKEEANNIGIFMVALTCKAIASLYPEALSNSLSGKVTGVIIKGGGLEEAVSEITKLSIDRPVSEYRQAICRVDDLIAENKAKFEGDRISIDEDSVKAFSDQINVLMKQIGELNRFRMGGGRLPSDSIGKFTEIEPIMVDDMGRFRGIVENIDTKERLDVSGLVQRRAPPEDIEGAINAIEQFIKDTTTTVDESALLEHILALFKDSLPKNIIITDEVKAGFFGTGKPGLLVINKDLLNNPISFLHEITEYLKHNHPEIINQMKNLLDHSANVWLKQHEDKYIAQGRHDYFIQNRDHYIIRTFTRQVFKDKDMRLTEWIKDIQGLVNPSPVAPKKQFKSQETPEYVYMVFPSGYYPLITTCPTLKPEIPWEFVTSAPSVKEGELVLAFKNNGFVKVHRKFSVEVARKVAAKILTKQDENLTYRIWNILNDERTLPAFQGILSAVGIDDIYSYAQESMDYNFDLERPEMHQVIYKGKTYSIDEFKVQAPELFKREIELSQTLAFSGSHLYRAITNREWSDIQKSGYMTIRERDNFEETVGPQVRHFAGEEGYAGVIIRIPVLGPYFAQAGFQVARVTSVTPHFVVPEVLVSPVGQPEKWVTLNEYLRDKAEAKISQQKEALETRQAANVESLQSDPIPGRVVRIVVGQAKIERDTRGHAIGDGRTYEKTAMGISKGLSDNRFGVLEYDSTTGKTVMDERKQVLTFDIETPDQYQRHASDSDRARARQQAIDAFIASVRNALQGLPQGGSVVAYVPQVANGIQLVEIENGRLIIASEIQEAFRSELESHQLIMFPDAYSDLNPENEQYPDYDGRVALGRHVTAYYRGDNTSLDRIRTQLQRLGENPDDILSIGRDGILLFLRALRIKAIDYESIRQWQISQEAVATSL
ncbi:MAG: hypothetical protein JW800_02160 [Candidatus Omnitrophica bacterium]|nr:hypothetical protein [Candidatus Omnitrophota bacterium]